LWISSCAAWRRSKHVDRIFLLLAVVGASGLAAPATGRDLSLSDAVGLALEYNSGIRSARHDSAAALLTLRAARALRFPQVDLTAQSTFKNEIPSLVIDMPPINITRQVGSKDAYQADLEVSQPLFTGGRLANSIRAEQENSLAESAGLEAAKMTTAYECRAAYLDGMRSAALLAAAQASLARIEIIGRNVESLFQSGMADSIDILESEMALETARQAVADGTVAHAVSLTRLRALTGLDSGESVMFTERVSAPDAPVHRDIPEDITRPELLRLDHLARAADFTASAARAGYMPSLAGFAAYSVGRPNQDLFENKWNDYAMAGLRLSWGFNAADRTGKSVAAAWERARSVRAARDDLMDGLQAARETAVERMDYAYRSWERSGRQLDLARRKFELAQDRQQNGLLSVNDLLQMEADLTAMDQHYQAALIGYYLADADYLYAVGSASIFGGLR
jgi:outer membrane protein